MSGAGHMGWTAATVEASYSTVALPGFVQVSAGVSAHVPASSSTTNRTVHGLCEAGVPGVTSRELNVATWRIATGGGL
jgi:hypothetical protein